MPLAGFLHLEGIQPEVQSGLFSWHIKVPLKSKETNTAFQNWSYGLYKRGTDRATHVDKEAESSQKAEPFSNNKWQVW